MLDRWRLCSITLLSICISLVLGFATFLPTTRAQATDPLAQQWADRRVEMERVTTFRRARLISDADYRARYGRFNAELQEILAQVKKRPAPEQAQLRQQSDSVFTVRILPLRQQWQAEIKEQGDKIRADIAADAKKAGLAQANRTMLTERSKRGEVSPTEFSNVDQTVQQELVVMQNKWSAIDATWLNLYTQSWQREMATALADLRKKDLEARTKPPEPPKPATATDEEVRTAVGLMLDVRRNQFLREKQAISPEEEQKRNTGPNTQYGNLRAKFSADVAKDFDSRVARLVDAGVMVRRTQWEQEARTLVAGGTPPAPAPAPNPTGDPNTPPPPGPPPTDPKTDPRPAPKAYVKEMPAVARVVQVIQGTSPADTVERQMGAFIWLQDLLYTMNGMNLQQRNINRLNAEEQRLLRSYTAARANIMQQPHVSDWYSFDPPFRNEVVRLLFPPQSEVYRANYDPNVIYTPPKRGPQGPSLPFELSALWVAVPILVLLGVGSAFVVYRRRSTKLRQSPVYREVKVPPRPAQPEPQQVSSRPPAATVPKTGSFKERLFAEQKEKYQIRYNDAVDEMTAVTVELTQMSSVVQEIQNNLRLLSNAVYSRVQTLIIEKSGGTARILRHALLWAPVYRFFKRVRLIGKILIIVVAWYFIVLPAFQSLEAGDYIWVGTIYAVVVAVFFLLERRQHLRLPLDLLKKNAANFRIAALSYVYENQAAHLVNDTLVYDTLRVSTATPNPEDITLPAGSDRPQIVPGIFLLTIGNNLATYLIDRKGKFALISGNPDIDFMKTHGPLLGEAVAEQTAFAANTLQPLADYGQVAARKRRADEELPRLEKLMREIEQLETLWRDTYASDKVFEFLLRRIDLFNMGDSATPHGILLYGADGNGKTHLVKKIAESVSAKLVQVNSATLTSAEEVKRVWEKNRGKDAVVLFVKNAGQVFPKPRSENEGAGTREATIAWIAEWEKFEAWQSRVWVVMTASNDQELHPSILTQFSDSKIAIPAPDTQGRETILRMASKENRVPGNLPEWLARDTSGASIRELRDIVKAAKRQSAPNVPQDEHWREAIKAVRGTEGFDERARWDSLIISEDTLEKLQTVCESLRSIDSLEKQGIDPPRGALLFGPPGTGKTQIARTLANESGLPFIAAAPADLKAGYIGQSGQKVQALFEKARGKAPCILFIDEFDSSGAVRGGPHADQFTDEIVNGLLAQMDGVQKPGHHVFVIAATNHPDRIDDAILSRLMYKIEIPLPDLEQRQRLFKIFLGRQKRVDFDVDEMATEMAKKAGNISGRDIDNIVRSASQHAVQRAFAARTPDQIVLSRADLLSVLSPTLKEISDAELEKIWSKIVLRPDIKESILSKIRMFNSGDKAAPRGLLLYGVPGTGKTEIARRIADSTNSFFMSLTLADLKAGYIGQSGQKVREIWDKARARGRCVMFVDECEGVFGRRGGTNSDSFSDDVIREFLAMWDGVGSKGQVWVVGATNHRDRLDDAIMSRFGGAWEIGLPEAPERLQILKLELEKLEREAEIPEFVGAETRGLAGRDLATLARDVCTRASERKTDITPEIWKEVLKQFVSSTIEPVDPGAKWETLVIAADTLKKLKTVCESLRTIEDLRKQNIVPPRGALLFGPPGTGKTQIARTLANESGIPFIAAGPADIKGTHLGQSGQKVRELFERARGKAPCILFIDEFDSGAPSRGGAHADQYTQEIVDEMLTQLDGVKKTDRHVFLVAATNYPERIDSAILSRMAFKIEVPNPDEEQRAQLFKIFLRKQKVDFDIDEMATELARRAGNIGGRAISDIVTGATQLALQRAYDTGTTKQIVLKREDLLAQFTPQLKEVSQDDLEKVWSQIVLKPDIKQSILSKIRMFNTGDKATPRGMLLYGPPGTGKTEIARRIADSTNSFFMPLTLSDLKAGFIGQTGQRVREVWEKAQARGRCIMFVDECEGVFGRRGGLNSDSFTDDAVREFLAMWDGVGSKGQIWVVGATNQYDRLDEAIVSRFGAAFEIGLPAAPERLQILRLEMRKLERDVEVPEFAGGLTTGFSGRNLAIVARDICTLAAERNGEITPDMWREVIRRYIRVEPVDDGPSWNSLILPEPIVKKLQTFAGTLRNAEVLAKQGFEPLRGALLYGPPGTGKTQIARTLANESGVAFIAAGLSDLKAGFVGQSVQKVNELFERARAKAPCILFVDEIETSLADRKGGHADQFTEEIVTEFLRHMDGVKKTDRYVFVLGATNLPERMDPAILSRFEEKIEIPLPGPVEKQAMFAVFLRKYRVDFDVEGVAAELAPMCGAVSGRDIQNLIRNAAQQAVQRALAANTPDQVTLTREDLVSQIRRSAHA